MSALVKNKKAWFDYDIQEIYEAGIELRGFEVKALREKKGSLGGSHVIIRGGETYMVNAHIPPVQPANAPSDFDPYRPRRLLLSKKEIYTLANYEDAKGLTIVPLSMYNKNGYVKVEIAVVKGKKKYDKRQKIKERDVARDMDREIKDTIR